MDETQQLPTTIADLIEWLEAAYPNKIATRELSGYEQGVLRGQQDLIQKIKEIELAKET